MRKNVSVLAVGISTVILGGAGLARAQSPIRLDARDAPLRAVLELVLASSGRSFQIGGGVGGLVSVKKERASLAAVLSELAKSSRQSMRWTIAPDRVTVDSVGDAPPALRFPPNPPDFARVAAVVTMGKVQKALVEFGAPPQSAITIVAPGALILDQTSGIEWKVETIDETGCILVAGSKRRRIALMGLFPPKTFGRNK